MFLSKTPGIGGRLKSTPEDFIVEEIAPDGTVYEIGKTFSKEGKGKFTHFILQKKDWSTSSAILEIAKRLNTGHKRFSSAGTKDKIAVTTQRVSAFDIPKEKILSLKIRDIQINGAWYSEDKVRMGGLLGNRFTIRVEDADDSNVEKISAELDGKFPNYFGEQRFGSTRRNTHIIGENILKEGFESAAKTFLCDSEGEENELATDARKSLQETNDYGKALKDYPKHLRLERKMIAHLEKNHEDFKGAFRMLPRSTLLLFIHAFQSHLFNRMLSSRIKEGPLELEEGEYFCGETLGFPDTSKTDAEGWICGKIIGYRTPINEREKAILEEYGITKEHFMMKGMPEIASKGTYRTLLAPLKNFSYDGVFRFELPSGSYATVAMGEFIKG